LNNVQFAAREGEVTALIGPNGAGKSALLNCISGHYVPLPSARIRVGERRIETMVPHRRAAAGVARTFQHIHLVPELTVLENVMTGLTPVLDDGLVSCLARPLRQHRRERIRHERAITALAAFGLEADAGAHVGSLPLGTRRRVDLARATISEPRLLLLDEPASGMSRTERALIPEWVAASQKQRPFAVVWIEHDVDLLLSIADVVVVLQQGEVRATGRPRESAADRKALLDAYFGREA